MQRKKQTFRKVPEKNRKQKAKPGKKPDPIRLFCDFFNIENLPQHYANKAAISRLWEFHRELKIDKVYVNILIKNCSRLLKTPEHIAELTNALKKYFNEPTIIWFITNALPIFDKANIASNQIKELLLLISTVKRACEERKLTPTPIFEELARQKDLKEMKKKVSKFLQSKPS
ncbi:MAG: hypothetical protein DRO04_00275 [Candidatus Iainarchaeum archaeon]|uniref:Uncharacterized protein n=1 Tax=Candidatus Iainarchaeum sp. TaxID=3101447 RepID=A0A497JIB7_9ARCH|nr:MAG: hypothetical protein DRO04_00275 [Candidatus Diapherotrites archaeon]